MKQKLTPWYPGEIKPIRIGVYERQYPARSWTSYCYWDGRIFSQGWKAPEPAKEYRNLPSASSYQNLPWRGVAR